MIDLDDADRALLSRLQVGLPVVARPFADLGEGLDLDEGRVLVRLQRLRAAGIIRQIGPIFDARRLGYDSTLAAFHVGEPDLECAAERVSAHPGVSHNYGRAHHYNLWFTLAVPPGKDVEAEIGLLAQQCGVDDWLNLPALRVFKLKTQFELEGGADAALSSAGSEAAEANSRDGAEAAISPSALRGSQSTSGRERESSAGSRGCPDAGLPVLAAGSVWSGESSAGNSGGTANGRMAGGRIDSSPPVEDAGLAPAEIALVRALQDDLPLVERPFAAAAARLGLSEDELLERVRGLQLAGTIRRLGAVLRHRRVGYGANGMACWAAPEAEIEALGRAAAALPEVSHCYQRPAYPPRWPYTLFTMIHGRTTADVAAVIDRLAAQAGSIPHEVLYSTREFKKERVRYFEVT